MNAKGNVKEHGRPRSGAQESFPSSEILAGRIDLQMQLNEWYANANILITCTVCRMRGRGRGWMGSVSKIKLA